jgi:hypothetical protein
VRIAIDPTAALLAHDQLGPMALEMGFCLALAALSARHRVAFTYLGLRPPTSEFTRMAHLGAMIRAVSSVSPAPGRLPDPAHAICVDLYGPRANLSVFLLTHVGYPMVSLDRLIRALREKVDGATVFLLASPDDFFPEGGQARDPETGRVVLLPGDPEAFLTSYLDRATALGHSLGTRLEPLIIQDHYRDIDSMLPDLALLE